MTDDEDVPDRQVVILGRAVSDGLFPAADPLGQAVRIAGRGFRIIGLQARQGTAGGVSLDRYVWMPLRAFERAFGAAASAAGLRQGDRTGRQHGRPRTTRASRCARAAISARGRRHVRHHHPRASRSFVTAITERIGAAARRFR